MRKIYLYGLLSMLALTVLAGCKEKEEPNGEKRQILSVTYNSNDEETARTEWKYDGKNTIRTNYENGKETYRLETIYNGQNFTETHFVRGVENSRSETYFNNNTKTTYYYNKGVLQLKTIEQGNQETQYYYSGGIFTEKVVLYLDNNREAYRTETFDADSVLKKYMFRTWEGENYIDSTFQDGLLIGINLGQWVDDYTFESSSYFVSYGIANSEFTSKGTKVFAEKEHIKVVRVSFDNHSYSFDYHYSYGDGYVIEDYYENGEFVYNQKTEAIEESDLRQRVNRYNLNDGVYVLSQYTINEYAYF